MEYRIATVGILYLLPKARANISWEILLIPYGFCGFDTVSGVVVQINGKVREKLQLSRDTEKKDVESQAKEQTKIQHHLLDKTIIKSIYVPNKLINFVIK